MAREPCDLWGWEVGAGRSLHTPARGFTLRSRGCDQPLGVGRLRTSVGQQEEGVSPGGATMCPGKAVHRQKLPALAM